MQKASAPPDFLFKLLKAEIEKARREREYASDRLVNWVRSSPYTQRTGTPHPPAIKLSRTRTMNPLLLFLSLMVRLT